MTYRKKILKDIKILSSEITPRSAYLNRRELLRTSAAAAAAVAFPASSATLPNQRGTKLDGVNKSPLSTDTAPNSYEDITSYNNFYEFGTGKDDPVRNAQEFEPRPWSLEITGEAEETGTFNLEDFISPHTLEERIYRFRCVEAWSMVIPWVGIPLADIIKRHKPLSSAKYVAFETLHDPSRMPGQRSRVLQWPYREGLTIAEAMHPLTILAVGLYGEVLPNQNGAPIRLIVPWKYGFKGIKSIVKIHFTEQQPETSWNISAAREYGFYANVNPAVSHPRWSQARERAIGTGLFASRIDTLPFNGYADQVADLYSGLDLRRNF
ncbi:MAG: protein-methionine-sulfoxide reductase catalytic subunit MsrP [Proteobacteria bacterium]|jgi:methionine sulfoxide reductase catalytic subunit|nr:protein-methionine-sulfoxide reductase catalytic subunit MsrP [Pseudomonadota bacterium]